MCFNSQNQTELQFDYYSNTELEKALEKEIEKINEVSTEMETEQTISCFESLLSCFSFLIT